MPGWQQFYKENHNESFELISVAIDVQGAGRPLHYVNEACAKFPTLLDKSNMLGRLLGFRMVPNGFLVDEDGVLRYREIGKFNIESPATRKMLIRWAQGSDINPDNVLNTREFHQMLPEVRHMFERGLELYEIGMPHQSIDIWKKALELDPDNYIVRKQIWAVENPEKFYSGKIDTDWQKTRR